ncbi:Bifunctional dihydrofolate reductase-thymidylate synthase [Phytophthora fragariae]|uniref:Bifunctional dihydrofolate reductase-thymidylate synthase n=1 Tax=Phytophthora fragariae TaxID=53985 RepID=A0A6A4A219_9STRA|nr:Bifunctional dihydrofolate reductase-thymidylate synthase [Phytophthora fragariae]KAE9022699.1 Bifunctional dihydrofolate reductase-thymidylate synthase [Phytophthora fragariae]KAE9133880.1 Bifunctional dihydrofolate reductase-thymidylate synthase [Phytophthora fragariae]KAE9151120.1 Bifunctional dihydrofolate reductase-thymidylate synthase [Phytophthora fragariae]KAE9231279.1 Bifunctional dihydrofolate reductase-thymidylate synthase [Phytophthora fragariae]
MSERSVRVVVAALEATGGIGLRQQIPWRLPSDMKHFRALTTAPASSSAQHAVIMGRKTWESLPTKVRPMPQRYNVVLTRDASYRQSQGVPDSVGVAASFLEALELVQQQGQKVDQVFVIGGGAVYAEALACTGCNKVHLTRVKGAFECDAFFPLEQLKQNFKVTHESELKEENGVQFQFVEWERKTEEVETTTLTDSTMPHEEMQYLDLIRKILTQGAKRGDRTGTGTLSVFGAQMRFSLRGNVFPLLTTKRVFWRGVAEELLWFISGDTSAHTLQEKDIHIWDGNGSREYLDSRGLQSREVGDLGPVYGFQWRHFGAKYTDMHADYTGQGVDQLAEVIDKLRTNPTDRRIVLSAWNPADLNEMALPPCHMFCQFYVADGELSCQMYQRSADMGLGVPFNIASYALLTRLIAQKQLTRSPRPFPTLHINPEKTASIDDFTFEDLEVRDYSPHGTIKMAMSV